MVKATGNPDKPRTGGFRLGVYVFKDAEIVDYAAPYGVFSVARRVDPELDAFLVADAMRPVQTQAGFTVQPTSDEFGSSSKRALECMRVEVAQARHAIAGQSDCFALFRGFA